MNDIIIYLTFITWILYYSRVCSYAIKDTKKIKITLSWLKKNIFKMFHIDMIILIGIFIYFVSYEQDLVTKMLFSTINIYLFVNSFYDTRRTSKIKTIKSENNVIIATFIISLLPIIYYFITKELTNTYYIMLGYSFFYYIVVFICRFIIKIFGFKNEKR